MKTLRAYASALRAWLFGMAVDNLPWFSQTRAGYFPIRQLSKLFLTGGIYTLFVAMTTVFIAHQSYLANFFSALAVNLIWALNIKRMAEGTSKDRMAYALGAATGSVSGSLIGGMFV